MSLFKRGFAKYLESGLFSDIALVTEDGTEHRAHRVVLAHSCDYFNRLLDSDWKESIHARVELKFPDPEGLFPSVLHFMYTGRITITKVNAIPLLAMADHYFIHNLKRLTSDYISGSITRDNVMEIFSKAVQYRAQDVIDSCVLVVARNFWYLVGKKNEDLTFLSVDLLQQVLQNEFLAVKAEGPLFRALISYVEAKREHLSDVDIRRLFENVRFRWLGYDELVEAQGNPFVPKDFIVEALMVRLQRHEGRQPEVDPSNERLKPRRSFGINFQHQSPFDGNGILYWIATNRGAEEWSNPHVTSRVIASASALEKGSTEMLLDCKPTELWTKDVPASWFMIDLGAGRSVVPSCYSLRHGGNYKADSLRNWDFQGRHTNDASLNSAYGQHTWPIEGVTEAYRYFRILQTGHNSSNHNFLVLSGIELYGDLYEQSSYY